MSFAKRRPGVISPYSGYLKKLAAYKSKTCSIAAGEMLAILVNYFCQSNQEIKMRREAFFSVMSLSPAAVGV